MLRQQFVALDRWQRELGGVIEIPLGLGSFVLLTESGVASEMLVDKARNFVRGGPAWDSLSTVFGNGLIGSEGELWRERRRMVQPHLHQDAVRRLIASMSTAVDEVCELWTARATNQPVDVEQAIAQITMAVILRVLFGSGMTDDEYQRAAISLRDAISSIAVGWLTYKLPRWLPIPGRARFRRAIADIDRMVFELAEQRRASKRFSDDILGMLVEHAEQGALDRKGLRDEMVSLFVAGYETTANTLGFAVWELAKRPELHASLREQADDLLGNTSDIDISTIAKLTHAEQVFRESLRMYPGALWLPRIALADDTLGGLPIRAGTTVVASLYNIHRDPKIWDRPEQFRPERHASPTAELRAWMPFGLGQHMCVGQRLAMAEGPLILARIAQRFELAALADRPPKLKMSTALDTIDGIWVHLRPR